LYRLSNLDKERIIQAFENGEDYYLLGKQLGASHGATRGIVYRYRKKGLITTGRRGGYRKPKINEQMGEKLLEFLEICPDSTLLELSKFLLEKFHVSCSISTVDRFLSGKMYSIKKISASVQEKNSDRVKNERKEYATTFLEDQWLSSQCIYIDETGFNIWMRRSHGRSEIGTQIHAVIPNCRGSNITLIMAISKRGPIHHKILMGSATKEKYQQFINELDEKLPPTRHYLIQDNASIHKNVNSTHEMKYLPPYSPFLNPIEAVFSKLKLLVRTKLSKMPLISIPKPERTDLLNNLISEMVGNGDFLDLRKYYKHIEKFFPRCISKDDIFGD